MPISSSEACTVMWDAFLFLICIPFSLFVFISLPIIYNLMPQVLKKDFHCTSPKCYILGACCPILLCIKKLDAPRIPPKNTSSATIVWLLSFASALTCSNILSDIIESSRPEIYLKCHIMCYLRFVFYV